MPILVRPVREQLEHDRIIRLLEAKWKRKFKVEANPGDEKNAGIKVSTGSIFPDLVLTEEGGRKPKALIEVETSESVNHLEARAQWAHLAKSRMSLVLFVPAGAVESARRLADENGIKVSELWTYLVLGDQVRFTSVFRERGLEPADLVEKADVFTTERTAPIVRPLPVEAPVPEPAPVPPPADRPRKLAVKIASKGAIAEAPVRTLPKVAVKAAPPPVAAKAVPAVPAAKPSKVDASPIAKVMAAAKAPEKKPVEKPVSVKPIPAPAPPKAAADKPIAPAKKGPEKHDKADKIEKLDKVEKPVKVAEKPKIEKPAKVEPKVAVKAAPAKAVVKKVVPKPAPKPPVKKAAPVKAAPKPAAPKPAAKKPAAKAPAKPAGAGKRK